MHCKSGKPQGPVGQDSPSFPWDMNIFPLSAFQAWNLGPQVPSYSSQDKQERCFPTSTGDRMAFTLHGQQRRLSWPQGDRESLDLRSSLSCCPGRARKRKVSAFPGERSQLLRQRFL